MKKASGIDGISARIMKLGQDEIIQPLTSIVNYSLLNSTFPDRMKVAQVVPLHKKNSTLEKGNYRPVSVLPVLSKIFERAIHCQLVKFFNHHFNDYLSAFRPGYGCQTVLLKVIEDWKRALDENKYLAAILMDLSKAFDCIPHDLLLLKLKAYGLADNAVHLIKSYLSNRKQCVKVNDVCSNFLDLYKGVPQGSILGPVIFNIFLNDIFYFVTNCDLYNYADDNTLSYASSNIIEIKQVLETNSSILVEWFSNNQMQANPDKFQAICIGKKTNNANLIFNIEGTEIKPEECVKLLGVTIDYQLKFKEHISNVCRRASQQLNVLKRIGRFLKRLGRLTVYHTFIMSNFNYCPLTWHFCGEVETKKLEKIQQRVLRFIYEDHVSSYETLLHKSKMPSLKLRRMRTLALETFRIIHKETPVYLHDIINVKHNSYSFRYSNLVEIPQVRTTFYGKNSFRFGAAKLWNSLPNSFRQISSFNQFKSQITSWEGESCKCSACMCVYMFSLE